MTQQRGHTKDLTNFTYIPLKLLAQFITLGSKVKNLVLTKDITIIDTLITLKEEWSYYYDNTLSVG